MATIPQSIPNLVLWLDGNDPAGNGTPPANSAVITTWVDKSTSAANGTTTGKATYQTSFANGYGSVRFGTAGVGYIQNNSFTLTLSSKTFFMVCSSYAATTNGDPAGFMSFGNTGAVYDQQNGTAYQGPESAYANKFGFLQAFTNGGYYTSFGSPFGETPLGIYGDTQSGTAAAIYVNGSNIANNKYSAMRKDGRPANNPSKYKPPSCGHILLLQNLHTPHDFNKSRSSSYLQRHLWILLYEQCFPLYNGPRRI
jgi:hypothetical protein